MTDIPIEHESDIVVARREGRVIAASLGFTSGELAIIATAISEVARNIVAYAHSGVIIVEIVERNGRRGLQVIAKDNGPGIANIEQAMTDGFSTSNGLGLGLPGARRLMDEFQLDSVVGKGTTVTMLKWAR
jgi:serine/threonine-protein kinase RsbT